jgi:hypothetical protein
MHNIFFQIFWIVVFSMCPANESHKDLNWVISLGLTFLSLRTSNASKEYFAVSAIALSYIKCIYDSSSFC